MAGRKFSFSSENFNKEECQTGDDIRFKLNPMLTDAKY